MHAFAATHGHEYTVMEILTSIMTETVVETLLTLGS